MINVLIVDDSNVSRAVVRKSLGLAQVPIARIFEAADGLEALSILKANEIGLVLADIHMPNMTGLELVAEMRASARFHATPVVIVSSDGNQKHREQLQLHGVRGILKKPFRPEQVGALVRTIIREVGKVD